MFSKLGYLKFYTDPKYNDLTRLHKLSFQPQKSIEDPSPNLLQIIYKQTQPNNDKIIVR